jgi:NDP-sugar pyrophosphorylase family protein
MKAIILVGGQGTRMRPLTDHTPKNIVPLCGTPFLTYQFEFLKKAGIREVVLSIGYLPREIKKVYGDGEKLGMKLHYAVEREALGTAGAVKNAEKFVKGSSVVVLNGDILTDLPLKQMIDHHKKNGNLATLGLVRVPDPTIYGLVLLDGESRILQFLEKPSKKEAVDDTINAGVYLFEPGVFGFIPAGVNYSSERALFPGLLAAKAAFGGFVWQGYWQDIGTPHKYLTTNWDVLEGAFPVHGPYRRKGKVYLGKGVRIAKGAKVSGPAILGDGCEVKERAQVLPFTVMGKDCVVGFGARVSKSVLWDGVKIGEGSVVQESVLGSRSKVVDGSKPPSGTVLGDGGKA